MNSRIRKDNRSGVKGVTLVRPGKWRAEIKARKKRKHLGYFDSLEEAAAAIRKVREEIHKEFTHHG
jgi:hypothetical protein